MENVCQNFLTPVIWSVIIVVIMSARNFSIMTYGIWHASRTNVI